MEAKELPDFTGTDNNFVSLTLNGLIIDKKMLSVKSGFRIFTASFKTAGRYGKSGTHTRIVGLDRETNMELLLKHIRSNGNTGTQFKELQQVLPNLSRNEIKVLIRELKNKNLIYAKGRTSAARWFAY